MKLVKKENESRVRICLDNKKTITPYKVYLYDKTGIIGKRDNTFFYDLVFEAEIPDVIFSEPDFNKNASFVGVDRNEYGRKQKVLYLPTTINCKYVTAKSKAGEVAEKLTDYQIHFYKTLISVSDYYFALKKEMNED